MKPLGLVVLAGALLFSTPVLSVDDSPIGPGRLDPHLPDGVYCKCSDALSAAGDMLGGLSGNAVTAVHEADQVLDDILATRHFQLVIDSAPDKPLQGRITWTGSSWHRLIALDDAVRVLEGILLPLAPQWVGTVAALRGASRELVEGVRELDPDSGASNGMEAGRALALIQNLHAQTEQMVTLAREVRTRLYCEYALPRELSLIAALQGVRHNCLQDYCATGPMARMRNARTGSTCWAAHKAGDANRADWDEMSWDILTFAELGDVPLTEESAFEAVAAAVNSCRDLGMTVTPAALSPAPARSCDAVDLSDIGPLPPNTDGVAVLQDAERGTKCEDFYAHRGLYDPVIIVIPDDANVTCPEGYIRRGKTDVGGVDGRMCAFCGAGYTKSQLHRYSCCEQSALPGAAAEAED